jgi:hypothetical protein
MWGRGATGFCASSLAWYAVDKCIGLQALYCQPWHTAKELHCIAAHLVDDEPLTWIEPNL